MTFCGHLPNSIDINIHLLMSLSTKEIIVFKKEVLIFFAPDPGRERNLPLTRVALLSQYLNPDKCNFPQDHHPLLS
jgi:hypothetical protein